MKNEKTCASFLKRKKKRKYYVPYMEMWKICTLHFAFCINLNDLNFVVSYFTYFPFCIFFSLVQQIFEKENCCMELNSAISLRWHAQYLCAQLFGLKAGNPFDVCRCVHLHCALYPLHCALCTVQCLQMCALALCSHSAGQVSQGYKGNNSNSAKNAKEAFSKSTWMQHALQCMLVPLANFRFYNS